MFKGGLLEKILGPKREKETEGLKKFHKKEIHDSYTIGLIKSWIKWWVESVAELKKERNI